MSLINYSRTSAKSMGLLMLVLLVLTCEALAWWWAVQTPRGGSLQGPTVLGLSGTLFTLALLVWLWQSHAPRNQGRLRPTTDEPKTAEQRLELMRLKLESLQAHQLLASTLDTLDVGLEIWDEQDRLMLYNNKINQLHIDSHTQTDIGRTFEALMRAKLKQGQIPAAIGCEEQWLAQRLATRGQHKQPQLKALAGNKWANTYETRTPEGYLVASWVDVTELVRRGKMLEASNQQLAQLSNMDELTGLPNRRHFNEALTTEWQRAARSTSHLSLLMVDIDYFKNFNDRYGHIAGDECLRRVARVLDRCVRRAGEMAARYGGEEFVVLLPGADMAHACETAQKCLNMMEQEAIAHEDSDTADHVTFSIGVACLLPDATLEPSLMINAADTAMYRAKSNGRARYEVANQTDWEISKDTPRTRPSPLS